MAANLIELGVSHASVQRQKKGTQAMESSQFDADSFARRGGRFAPTREELKAELQAYLRAHPETNRTQVAKLMAQHKHELIYTPPYLPGVQPIERLWVYVKNHVASQYRTGRMMRDSFDRRTKAYMEFPTSMLALMPSCVRVLSSTRTVSATISSSRTMR